MTRFDGFLEGDELGTNDKKWLRGHVKAFKKSHKALPDDQTSRLEALKKLTPEMTSVALEARERASKRTESTDPPLEKIVLGLGSSENRIIGERKSFDADTQKIFMILKTKKLPKEDIKPEIRWFSVPEEGKPVMIISTPIEKTFGEDVTTLTITGDIFLKKEGAKWQPGKYKVEVWYGEKRRAKKSYKIVGV